MIEFKIENKEYQIDEITIGQYYKVQHLLVSEGVNAKIEIISHLSGCPISDLKKLDQYQFLALWNSVAEGPLNTPEHSPLHKNFILNGKFYGFMDFSKMTIGEFSDMEVLRVDPLKASKLHIMMAVLYRPAVSVTEKLFVVEPYDSDNVMERAEEFLNMPLRYVYGALNFFLRVQRILLDNTLHYLTSQMTKEEMENLKPEERELMELMMHFILELQETGLTPSTFSLETILPKYQKLQDLTQSLYSTSSHTLKTNARKRKSFTSKLKDKIKSIRK